ncbi:MAG: hypothetical protein Q7T74_03195, partial [Candidatus Saccharibacteria bacterium]|nr:hypothetical protein [Candidatus Saccharibacteria bacterium]
PNGGENFVVGKTDTIKWLSANITNVKLVYSTNNGTDWISILTSTPASAGSFVWTIPNTPSTNCLVSISDVTNSSFTDISDNVFSIVNPGIVFDKPIQGDRYRYGSIVPITWHSTNVDNVNLEFSSDNGATWTMIVSNANAAPGEFNWTLPQNLSPNISIKVSDAKFPLIFSTSGLIEIFIPTVQITSPIGGEKWQGGTEQAISWTQKDVTRLKIEYTLDDNSWISIPDTIDANVGSYGWLIPKTESINARVRLTETIDTLVRDKSPEVFTIFIPKLAVTMPNGGETFVAGKTDTIKWTSGSLENVKLEFTTDNGLNWSSIITSTPAGSGMFVWTIPNSPSKNCKVKISDVLNPELSDQSDLPFTIIAPTITLLSPNGGEKWL